jgi:hypothetical protein
MQARAKARKLARLPAGHSIEHMTSACLQPRKRLRTPAGCESYLTRRQAALALGFASEFKIREFERQGLLRSVRGPMQTAFYPRHEILALKARLSLCEPQRASNDVWSDADLIALLEHPTPAGCKRTVLDLVVETHISIERAERVHGFWAKTRAPAAGIRVQPRTEKPNPAPVPEASTSQERRGPGRLSHDGLIRDLRNPDPRVRQQAFERLREERASLGE